MGGGQSISEQNKCFALVAGTTPAIPHIYLTTGHEGLLIDIGAYNLMGDQWLKRMARHAQR
eukprot:103399-Prorocentrum_lima.AAC.1